LNFLNCYILIISGHFKRCNDLLITFAPLDIIATPYLYIILSTEYWLTFKINLWLYKGQFLKYQVQKCWPGHLNRRHLFVFIKHLLNF